MKKKLLIVTLILMAMLCMTGCPDSATKDAAIPNEEPVATSGDIDEAETENAAESDSLFAESSDGQKLVYEGDVTIGTDNMKKTVENVTANMKDCGAFFESINSSSGAKTMYIRIPKKNYMKFYESLSDVGGEVTYSRVLVTDKTKTFTDNAKRIDILETEYKELKELMEKANTVEEVLSIRDRMSDVTYEIEQLKGENDTIDYDSDYGTLTLEIELNGAHEAESFGHQIKEAFSGGFFLLKHLIIGIAYLWWVVLIAAYAIYASKKKMWPFKKTAKAKKTPVVEVPSSEEPKSEESEEDASEESAKASKEPKDKK